MVVNLADYNLEYGYDIIRFLFFTLMRQDNCIDANQRCQVKTCLVIDWLQRLSASRRAANSSVPV
jgi:hypothetical protein